MKCKFFYLHYGDNVTIEFTGNANCENCGASLKDFGITKIDAVYVGHVGIYDMFHLPIGFPCPSCGGFTNGYSEICDDSGGMTFQATQLQEKNES